MPKLVKESDGDQKNCGKKRQQPASSKGKGQKTLAVKTRKSPQKRIQEEEGGASGTEGEQSEISDAESMASQASKSSQSKPMSLSKSSSASASQLAVGVPIEEITRDQMQQIADFYEGHPMYYDVGHKNYKNTKLKEWTLDKFSECIELSGETLSAFEMSDGVRCLQKKRMKYD